MGAACTSAPAPPPGKRPGSIDDGAPEYFGPPGGKIQVPMDLKIWKSQLAEQRRRDLEQAEKDGLGEEDPAQDSNPLPKDEAQL